MMKYLMRLLVDVAPSVCPRGLRGRTRDLKLPSGVEHLERGEEVILNCKDNRSQQNKAPFPCQLIHTRYLWLRRLSSGKLEAE